MDQVMTLTQVFLVTMGFGVVVGCLGLWFVLGAKPKATGMVGSEHVGEDAVVGRTSRVVEEVRVGRESEPAQQTGYFIHQSETKITAVAKR